MDLGSLVASVVTTLGLIVGIYVIARKLGLGPAAQMLSTTLQQTMVAQANEIASLTRQRLQDHEQMSEMQKTIDSLTRELKVCKTQLAKLQKYIATHQIATDDDN